MALEQITFNIAAFKDSDAAGNNYYAGAIYEVFNLNDTLADIYSDAAGTIPITQDGINNSSDSDGECELYIAEGAYYLLVSGKRRDFTVGFDDLILINDLSQAYEFNTVALMTSSTIVFPVNKTLVTKGGVSLGDGRGATFIVLPNSSTPNDEVLDNGNFAVWQQRLAEQSSYNNSVSGLGATQVQEAIDELDINSKELGYLRSELKPTAPVGQIANEAESVTAYKGALYCLFKGSYSGNDRSYISVLRPNGNDLEESGRVDLDIGADARAMTIHDDSLIVFTTGKIEVFRFIDTLLQKKYEITRAGGFVQSCRVINGYLYACNWGNGTVEVYELIEGIPSNMRSFAVGAVGNASIASWGNIHYLISWTDTNNLTRLDLNRDGSINTRGTYTISNVWRPRYAKIENGIMYIGGYSTTSAKTVIVDISKQTPIKLGEVMNMSTSIKVGNYLIGTGTDQTAGFEGFYTKLCRVEISTGNIEIIDTRSFAYFTAYDDTFFAFIAGDEGIQPGAHPTDGEIGQAVSVWTNTAKGKANFVTKNELGDKLRDPLKLTAVGSYSNGTVLGKVADLLPILNGFFRGRLRYQITNNQGTIGLWSSTTADIAYSFYKDSGGTWMQVETPVVIERSGPLTTNLELAIVGNEVLLQIVGSSLTNALVTAELEYERTNVESSGFIYAGLLTL